MVKCSFSGNEIPPGRGRMYVRKDGRVLYFDSSKSFKNFLKLGRKPRSISWTQDGRKAKEERMRSTSAPTEK